MAVSSHPRLLESSVTFFSFLEHPVRQERIATPTAEQVQTFELCTGFLLERKWVMHRLGATQLYKSYFRRSNTPPNIL